MRKYPDKLHFINKITDLKYALHYEYDEDMGDVWRCTRYEEETPRGWEAKYTSQELSDKFATGDWVRLDEDGNEEHPLKFPFTIRETCGGDEHVVTQGSMPNAVTLYDKSLNRHYENLYSKKWAENAIKNGDWIVISVGGQKPLEVPTSKESKSNVLTVAVDAKDAVEAVITFVQAMQVYKHAAKQLEDAMSDAVTAINKTFGVE